MENAHKFGPESLKKQLVSGSRLGPVAGSYGHSNEPSCSIRCGKSD